MRLPQARYLIGLIALIVFVCVGISTDSFATDKENCLMCHKYSGIGRIEHDGTRRIFYVNEKVFRKSVHGALRCRQCHQDIRAIPHTGTKQVSCTVDCHMLEPSTKGWKEKKNFSHKRVEEVFNDSVHNPNTDSNGKARATVNDVPGCKYCHTNPLYYTGADAAAKKFELMEDAIAKDVCGQCHEDLKWAKRFYGHFSRRINKRRGAEQMVKLCLSCHSDVNMMSRNSLPPINSFEDTFHFKAIQFGDTRVPDCLGCHAPLGYPAHKIKGHSDPESSVYPGKHTDEETGRTTTKVERTCGLPACHGEGTSEKFASGRVHNIDVDIIAFEGDASILAATTYMEKISATSDKFNDLMQHETQKTSGKTDFEVQLINILRFVYLYFIIAPTLIGMLFHQLLDFYSTLRDRNKGGHH